MVEGVTRGMGLDRLQSYRGVSCVTESPPVSSQERIRRDWIKRFEKKGVLSGRLPGQSGV